MLDEEKLEHKLVDIKTHTLDTQIFNIGQRQNYSL